MIGDDILREVQRLLRPLKVRIANTVARAVVQLVDDSKKLQLVQVGAMAGEDIDDGEHFQDYGFSSVPFEGAEAVVLFPGGDRAHPLVIAVDDRRHRPTEGEPGEVVLYTDEGDEIRLARGNLVVITAGTGVRLGSASAADGVIRGTQRDTAEQTFLTAMDTFIGLVTPTTGAPAAAITAFRGAITAFAAAATAAVSTKVRTE